MMSFGISQWSTLFLSWVLVSGRGAGSVVLVPPDSSSVRLVGRFDQRGKDGARFDMNGCEIQFRVQGASRVEVKLSQQISPQVPGPLQPSGFQANDFLVFVDGVAQASPSQGSNCSFCTFDTSHARPNTVETYVVADGLTPGEHDIRLLKSTEPQWVVRVPSPNWMTFHGLSLDSGTVLAPSKPRPIRRLEFVGDSITAGYCNLCAGPTQKQERTARMLGSMNEDVVDPPSGSLRRRRAAQGGPWLEAFALGWPTKICEALDAECHTAAWSGFGMIENCCGGNTTMPEIWRRTIATDETSQWDFSSWIPHGLVINLGTNDNVWARNASYSETYFEMVMNASKAYGPELHVFLACGPMENKVIVYCPYVEEIVARATVAGVKAHFLDQRGFLNGSHGPSCCGHPGTEVDAAMARQGAAFIASTLGWESSAVIAAQTQHSVMHFLQKVPQDLPDDIRLAPLSSSPLTSGLLSVLTEAEPDMTPFNLLLSSLIPRLNQALHHQKGLPMSCGNCSANAPSQAPQPCLERQGLPSVHKPWRYSAAVRWVSGLRTLNFTSARLVWNESSHGVSMRLRGLFAELSASIVIAECITFNHCRTIFDNTDACCGSNKHFEVDIEAFCGQHDEIIDSFNVSSVALDSFEINERILGIKMHIANITKELESTIFNLLKKAVALLSPFLVSHLKHNPMAARIVTAMCRKGVPPASTCRSAFANAPLEAKGLMFFAMGKQFYDQGSFAVCKEIPRHMGLTNFSTKHFTVSYSVEGIPGELGFCMPSACTNDDIRQMLQYLQTKEPMTSAIDLTIPTYALSYPQPKGTLRHPNPVNDVDDTIKWSDPKGSPILTPMAFGILFALVALVGWATHVTRLDMQRQQAVDRAQESREAGEAEPVSNQQQRSRLVNMKIVRAFTLVGPEGSWTALWQGGRYQPTHCLNGLRVISMIWIILGHSFLITGGCAGFFNGEDVVKNVLNPDAAATSPAWPLLDMPGMDLAVDTFFFISGFLASYIGSTRQTPFCIGVLQRYLRLAPCLAFALMIYTLILPFMATGPFAPRFQDAIFRRCHAWTWWTPLLFIMNFLPWYNDNVCMGWTWYLGNDMIFAIVGIALLNLWKWRNLSGWLATVLIAVASIATTFYLIWHYDLTVIDDPRSPHGSDYQYYLYDKPWSRIPAYLVGLVVPWVLLWAERKHGLRRGSQPKSRGAYAAVRVAFWSAIAVIFFLLFITYSNQDGGFGSSRVMSNWTTPQNDLYLTFGRPLWACAHAVIALACFFDYVPIVNGFLSHQIWNPLTKLTYNAYLLHPLMINLRCGLAVQYYQFSAWTLFGNCLTDTTLAYAAAMVAWCLVEQPVASLTGFLIKKPVSNVATTTNPSRGIQAETIVSK